MYWEYRVVDHTNDKEIWFSIHEIYYYSDGSIMGWIKSPADACGETLDEVRASIEDMETALSKPIYKVGELPK